jgi:hypothetical protein
MSQLFIAGKATWFADGGPTTQLDLRGYATSDPYFDCGQDHSVEIIVFVEQAMCQAHPHARGREGVIESG